MQKLIKFRYTHKLWNHDAVNGSRTLARWVLQLMCVTMLTACDHQPAGPGQIVRASSDAVLQCSVDTDCMFNRACDSGQCRVLNDKERAARLLFETAARDDYARREAEGACQAEAKAYMNAAVAAGVSEMSMPQYQPRACTSPTVAVTQFQVQNGDTIEFVPQSPGIARTLCNASTAKCEMTPSASGSVPNAMPADATATSASAMLDQLRRDAARAYAENRIYTPIGNNAVEYYLALRDQPQGDPDAVTALNGLLPLTVSGADQSIARMDLTEARRLVRLIERIDSGSPSLQRLRDSINAASQANATPEPLPQTTPKQRTSRSVARGLDNARPAAMPQSQPQETPRQSRYMGTDGCMYEADGRPVLGFKRECDGR